MTIYGDESGFEAYVEEHGYTVPAGDEAQALARASNYIDGTYGLRFSGVPTAGADQDRAWPRKNAFDYYGNSLDPATVPARVINATYEAALRELASPGSLSPDVTPGKVKKRVKVEGAVEVEYAVGDGDAASQRPVVGIIDGILAPLLMTSAAYPGVMVV